MSDGSAGGNGHRPRRALILAGGGTKVAFQAGVLQVWLDEAGLEFDLADGASGGVFNLAMWCQGMSGTQIADNWRNNRPIRGIQPSLHPATSLFKLDRFRRNVLRDEWGLSWPAIRATRREATFNLYNFTHHLQEVLEPAEMDEDKLISAVSLPIWFEPVVIDGSTYIDAVMATDANLEEALRRGADELWVIWTVSTRGDWNRGFIAHYFQMIEAMANGQLRAILRRIQDNNLAIAEGRPGEFGRSIRVEMLEAEVPLHYLMNFTRDRMAAAVELGVAAARTWCDERAIPYTPVTDVRPGPTGTSVRFTEEMTGSVQLGGSDPADVRRRGGSRDLHPMTFHLTIDTGDLSRFMVDPEHAATAVGWVEYQPFGGRRPVEHGEFNLFVNQEDPRDKRMLYRLTFTTADGRPLTLAGHKVITDNTGLDAWPDTTTLYTRILEGHLGPAQFERATVVAAGILRIRPAMFARQLTTFRASGPSLRARTKALARFGRLFTGALWDVYLTRALPTSPF
jgi:predicted acylesterase/phospholipase RssA